MFFPYRARIALYRFPIVTVLISVLCIGIYTAQYANQYSLYRSTESFCGKQHDPEFRQALNRTAGGAGVSNCARLMLTLYHAKDAKATLTAIVSRVKDSAGVTNANPREYVEQTLLQHYRSYRLGVPSNLTARLWYPPDSWNPLRMLSAAVAHGSWLHLIGNLLFFFAFAATVEILLGPVLFLGVLIALALGSHIVYSLAMMPNADSPPTLGLSGVVMGVIALFVYFIPRARISCFLWLIIFYRRFAVPAWLLAALYIGTDFYSQVTGTGAARVNIIAHLSGAAIGLLLGITFFRTKRHWARELVEERN